MDIQPTITVKDRSTGKKNTYRMNQESIIIGRDRSNFIVLASQRVSRNHTEIRFENGHFFVIDLESSNGTYLNSQRLTPREKMLLRSRDRIRIENFEVVFATNGTAQPDFGEITDNDIIEIKMIKKLLRSIDKENAPILDVVGGAHTGKHFILEGKTQEILIGRDPACEFTLDDESISRKHARLVKKWDTITLIDLASKNGVFVNDAQITEQVLSDGDRILLGTVPLVFRNPSDYNVDYLAAEPPPKTDAIPTEEEIAPPLGRASRRTSKDGTEEREAKPAPAPEQETPEESAAPEEQPAPDEDAPASPPEEPAPAPALAKTPIWQRFSPMEIAAALLGAGILIGSIWLLMKLL